MKHSQNTIRAFLATFLSLAVMFSFVACSGGNMDFGGYDGGISGAPLSDDRNADLTEGENYTEIIENAFVSVSENNKSYFSIDANTAAYPNLRNMINNGYTIPKGAVRVEEMLNYFTYDYATPKDGSVLALSASVFDTPYNSETKLLTIGLAAEAVEFTDVKNNLVFLIDTSGSMYSEDKLPLVQLAFMMLTENLNPDDRISIVTYAGSQTVALSGAYGYEKQKIMAVIEDLTAGGSTAGSDGIETAYTLAQQYFIEGGNNRVILATDGDFNVGITGTAALENFISQKRESGVYFSVFGFGRGNLQAEKMESLALNGNGTYSYIDSVKEAKRSLVTEMGGTMVTVAKDVKCGIVFHEDYVESFRLIGYENKLLTEEEFEDSTTDAGELGSDHTVTVVYEIKLKEGADLTAAGELATVEIKYKPTENAVQGDAAGEEESLLLPVDTDAYHENLTANDTFVASVVEFALILLDSDYKGDADLNALITRLEDLDLSTDEFKEEFREIVRCYRERVEQTEISSE